MAFCCLYVTWISRWFFSEKEVPGNPRLKKNSKYVISYAKQADWEAQHLIYCFQGDMGLSQGEAHQTMQHKNTGYLKSIRPSTQRPWDW